MSQPVADMLDRARHARSLRIRYELGRGGRDPAATSPADAEGRCDCSGFTAWAHRIDRRQVVYGDEVWLGTGGIIADAAGDRRWYEPLERPELGALLVYAADKQAGRPYGHVGIVTGGLPAEWDPRSLALWKALRVTHCHGPRGLVPSIEETGAMGWARHWGQRRGTVIVRRVA
jgi:hypothetical protein